MMAGYSGTPLAKKLGLKGGQRVALFAAPPGFRRSLESLPSGIQWKPRLRARWTASCSSPVLAELDRALPSARYPRCGRVSSSCDDSRTAELQEGSPGGVTMNGKTPVVLTLLATALLIAAVLILQPYSADFTGAAYAKPARRYIRAALDRDSLALTRVSSSMSPVIWALRAARQRPDSLAAWSGHMDAWTGEHRGDTTVVLVFGESKRCNMVPIVLRFVGSGNAARVSQASSTCLDSAR